MTEIENGVIDYNFDAGVVMFKGSDAHTRVGVLCGIERIEPAI